MAHIVRDLDLAIRDHDYARASAIARSVWDVGVISVSELEFLLRPSVAMAAAVMRDEDALAAVIDTAREYARQHSDGAGLIDKSRASRQTYAMLRWLDRTTSAEDLLPVEVILTRARERGFTKGVRQALKVLERHGAIHVSGEVVRWGKAPADQLSVPPFKQYFATVADMDDEQSAFYTTTFRPAFLRGDYVDLEGNLSYGFALMGELATEVGYDDMKPLRTVFQRAAAMYPDTPLASHATNWAADTYFLERDFQRGFDLLDSRHQVDLETYVGVAEELMDSRVTGAMAMLWTTSSHRLTPWGVRHTDHVLAEVELLLDIEHSQRGRSIVADLWQALAVERRPKEAEPQWVTDLLRDRLNPDEIGMSLAMMEIYGGRGRDSFRGLVAPTGPKIHWPSPAAEGLENNSAYGFGTIVEAYLQGVFRAAENRARAHAGVPLVGEGWISEVELYYALKEEFPETRVVHQGRPQWLDRQSLDVYLPEWSIGVEYQGEQHQRPVARFGGESAFALQQARDSRKRRLCVENETVLIEVLPGYVFTEVCSQIREARKSVPAANRQSS